MSEPSRQKPLPARPAFPTPRDTPRGVVTPTVVAPSADTDAIPSSGGTEREVSEARVSGRGGEWRVSVLGRSGRASARSAPLLLLGFSPDDAGASIPTLEATVAGCSLGELSEDALELALGRAVPPPTDTGRRPFFEDPDHGGRS